MSAEQGSEPTDRQARAGGAPLLEREGGLADVRAVLDGAAAGSGGALVLEGAGGVGKSRLLAEVPGEASARGVAELRARCGELEGELAWGVATGMLAPALSARAPSVRRRLVSGPAAPAAALFDQPVERAGVTADEARFAIVHALYLVLAGVGEAGPLVVVVDDLHWCDPPSLRFLVYLAARLADLPVALVAAMRTPAAGSDRELVDRLAFAPGTRVRRLGALSEASVATLVRAGDAFPGASDGLCAACHEATGGNPFYLRELLLELRERPIDPATGPADQLSALAPPSVTRSVAIRLGRVGGDDPIVLAHAVAVFGDRVALRHAAALAGLTIDRAATTADALVGADILAPGQPLEFIHPLVRAAIYADIPAARRSADHARAARLLDGEDAPGLAASHLLHAPPTADRRSLDLLVAAGRRSLERGAPAVAASYLRRALEEPPPVARRGDLLIELATAETAAGEPTAGDRLGDALELTRDAATRARILLGLGRIEHHQGRFAPAAATFERGLGEVSPDDRDLAAELEAGYFGAATLDSARAGEAHARARAIEARMPDPRGPAERALLCQVLFARTLAGDPHGETTALAERIWSHGRLLAEETADSEALWHVVGSLNWCDAYALADRILDEALADARRRGSALAYARGCYARAWPRYWTGRLSDAIADAQSAIDIWRGGMENYLPAAVYWLVVALLEQDQPAAAERALEQAGPHERWANSAMEIFLLGARGRIAAHRGRLRDALDAHLACGQLATHMRAVNPTLLPWRSDAALVAAHTDDREQARELAGEELRLAERFGAPRALGAAQRAAGLIEGGQPGHDLLTRAVRTLEDSGATLELARALIDLGAATRRSGQRAAARPHLTRGHELARRAGAVVLARAAETELRAAGARTRPHTRSGPDALTPSEQRIAQLAATGRSNREIANALFITVKGVEWHLHQAYGKLDIANRHQLPSALTPDPSPITG